MAIASPAITSFNAGEWSSLMQARSDVDRYRFSCRTLENFLPTTQGPARKRPGTLYVGAAHAADEQVTLIPWEFNRDTAYVLELSDLTMRIWRADGSIVESAPSTPLEVVTPWSDVEAARVQWAQVNNVMYLVHPDFSPRKLTRTSDTSWVLVDHYSLYARPADEQNTSAASYLQVSSLSGLSATCISSTSVFAPDMVGSYIWFYALIPASYSLWKPSTAYALNDYVYAERADIPGSYAVYQCTAGGTSGTSPIDNPKPGVNFTDGTAQWIFRHIDAAFAKIKAYISATEVTIDIGSGLTWSTFGAEQSRLPSTFLTGGPTDQAWRWALSAWSEDKGYPGSVAFYENRLVYGGVRARPTTIWGSRVDSYRLFNRIVSLDDEPFEYTLTDSKSSTIAWMISGDVLSVGTGSSEFSVSGGNGAITPTNAQVKVETRHGSDPQMPLVIGGSVFFVQRNGGTVREWLYDDSLQRRKGLDRTVVNDQIARNGVRRIQQVSEPDSVIFGIASDGTLVALTYELDEQVIGWSRHDIGAVIESIAAVPSPDGDNDSLWIACIRNVNGSDVRYIERMSTYIDDVWADCAVRITSSPATIAISGLDHLEGETVIVAANRAVHPDKVVSSGSITLEYASSDTLVGLPILGILEPQRLEGGSQNGTSQGKRKKISNIVLHLYETGGGLLYGTDADNMYEVEFKKAADFMDTSVPLFTGWTTKLALLHGHLGEGKLRIEHTLPQPCTIMAIYPQVDTEDDR
jgi:hypothetical protein